MELLAVLAVDAFYDLMPPERVTKMPCVWQSRKLCGLKDTAGLLSWLRCFDARVFLIKFFYASV